MADRPVHKGRGAQINPANRFGGIHAEDDFEHLADDPEWLAEIASLPTRYVPDHSRSIISENDSPDLSFRYSLNPYRGCLHGCSYCYARPTHEYLGQNAGQDFESVIFVKERAPELFREWLARDAWEPELIAFSGVTDCYQPAERNYRLTRQCLEVAAQARQPIGIVTKNALITRDIDVLSAMATDRVVKANISLTTLDAELARVMEPRTSTPAARLEAMRRLSGAGIPVTVMVAPVIPGLNDSEIPALLKAAADAGASAATWTLLRLPLSVEPIFLDWLDHHRPELRERIEHRLRSTRDGQLTNAEFGSRMRGSGVFADQIRSTFEVFARRHGLAKKLPPVDTSGFRRPLPRSGQLRLFD